MAKDYVKFILTGLPRTGTTLIGCSLLDHLEVLYYGELFNSNFDIRELEVKGIRLSTADNFQNKPHFSDYEIPPCRFDESGYEYLDWFYTRDVPFNVVGFKLLYRDVPEGANASAWDYLVDHPEIKIINMQRENMLDVIVSLGRADKTEIWHTNVNDIEPVKFKFTVKVIEETFSHFEQLQVDKQEIISSHEVLNTEYQKASFQETTSRIFSFLGVDADIKVYEKLRKIAKLKPSKEIINYQELKEYFKDTQYGKYFTY